MRKNFKRFLVLLSVAFMSATVALLAACAWDPASYHYDVEQLRAPVKKIELIYYDNTDQKHFKSWVTDHSG